MKKLSVIFTTILVLSLSLANAQNSRFSAGLVTSHFNNSDSRHQISNTDNPTGMGILAAYQVKDDFAVSLSTEYLTGDLKKAAGTEDNIRTNLSAFFFPLKMQYLNPYLSAGVVLNYRTKNYDNGSDKSNTQLQSRFGLGVDVPLWRNISLNLDAATYITEIRFAGWAQSIGLRYTL